MDNVAAPRDAHFDVGLGEKRDAPTEEEARQVSRDHFLPQWMSVDAHLGNAIHIRTAEGIYLHDSSGKRYIDLSSQAVCVNLGHSVKAIADAVHAQLLSLPFVDSRFFVDDTRTSVLKTLARIMPDMKRFYFSESGATAIEAAIRIARAYTGKRKILSGQRAYHGGTAASLTITGASYERRTYVEGGAGMEGTVRFLDRYPFITSWDEANEDPERGTARFLAYFEETLLMEGPSTIAAVVLEPVLGASGVLPSPKGYLEGIQRLCRAHGILLVADEVMGGFGRSGKWFSYQHYDVQPDIVAFAKGITNAAVPLGGVAITAPLAAFFETRDVPIGSTYNAHQVGLAAAASALHLYESLSIIDHTRQMGEVLTTGLASLRHDIPAVRAVRNIGLWGIVEITMERSQAAPFRKRMYEHGLYSLLRYNKFLNVLQVFVSPPLVIQETELKEALSSLRKVIESM